MRAVLLLLLRHKLQCELRRRLHKPPVIVICRPLVSCSPSSCGSRPQRTQEDGSSSHFKDGELAGWLLCPVIVTFLIVPSPEWRRQILQRRRSERRDHMILSLTFRAAVDPPEPTACNIRSLQRVGRTAKPSSSTPHHLTSSFAC